MSRSLPRLGVFGTGFASHKCIPLCRKIGFEVTAVWGITLEKARTLANEFDVPFHTSTLGDILIRSDVELVMILTPPYLHAEISVKALSAGKHVIVEKPPSLSLSDVEKMVTTARYYPMLLSALDSNLRFLPAFLRMRDLISTGYCGDVLVTEVRLHHPPIVSSKGYNWLCDEAMGGGALSLSGCQMIDIVTFVTRQRAVEVNGFLETFVKETSSIGGYRSITSDDFCTFQMRCSGGGCATVTINTHMHSRFCMELLVVGTKGRLVVRNTELYGQLNEERRERLIVKDERDCGGINVDDPEISRDIALPYLKGWILSMKALKDAFSHRTSDRLTIDCMEQSLVQSVATFEDGLYIQSVLDAIRLSSKRKRWAQVVMPEESAEANPFWTAARPERASPMAHRAMQS
ncbi:glucose-fructose oxidoreductase domain-containing protein 2-like [Oscarella lobularis]|uniref:glucose-fructose oxidoreductase domain-containing protein 2-like n=1 Tax=Oscarella lobularis TaxID=121494 RepID=UPI00331327A4